MSGIDAILATLNAQYTFDARGRISGALHDGVLPRFVLGRTGEGCIWRFHAGLDGEMVVALARLAGREPGASFEGELPAPPERSFALARILARDGGIVRAPRRSPITRDGVVRAELWIFD